MSAHPLVNAARGEVALQLASGTYRLRPSFAALASAESETGSLMALINAASAGDLKLTDLVTVLHACATAGGHDVSRDDFAGEIFAGHMAPAIDALKTILLGLVAAAPDANGQ